MFKKLGFFKLLGKFFDLVSQYDKEKARFVRYGYAAKSFRLILFLTFIAATLACEYGTFWLFRNLSPLEDGALAFFFGNGLKILGGAVLGYLTIGIAFNNIAIFIQNAILGFGSARNSKTISERVEEKTNSVIEKAIKDEEFVDAQDVAVEVKDVSTAKTEEGVIDLSKPKTSKGFNIFYGIFSILLIAGLVAGMVIMAII